MKKTLIVGAGRFGYTTANRLSELGAEVVVIDKNEKRLSALKSLVSNTLILDAIDRDAFASEIETGNFDAGVVAIGDDFSTALLAALYMKQGGIPYIVARASNPKQAKIFRKIGVELVVMPEDDMGHRLAEKLILKESEQIDLSPDTSIVRVVAPPGFIGKKLGEINFAEKGFNFLFVARKYTDQGFVKMAFPDETDFEVAENDYLLFSGDTRRIAAFLESAS
ncbi:TrkA family potassium uptake protein [bacterium]|nr:MAG: TrkA family potassium uptake protein [bacterium]